MPAEPTLIITVSANGHGVLRNPINIHGFRICKTGEYNILINGIETVVSISSFKNVKPDDEGLWVIASDPEFELDPIYYVGFNPKTMCDCDGNETDGESVTAKCSKRQARIFTNKQTAEQAIEVLKIISPSPQWRIVEF